jgi:hypothetical protein
MSPNYATTFRKCSCSAFLGMSARPSAGTKVQLAMAQLLVWLRLASLPIYPSHRRSPAATRADSDRPWRLNGQSMDVLQQAGPRNGHDSDGRSLLFYALLDQTVASVF